MAFWNPYDATGNLAVSIVNQDAGSETELTGPINVGDKVAEELRANDRLNFIEQGFNEAMTDLRSGKVFAVYVIPDDFSESLTSPASGRLKQPQIVYYTNEKLGPVSPKVTDTAASTLDQTINSMFVSTVGEAAARTADARMKDAETSEEAAREKAATNLDAATTAISDVRSKLADAQTALESAKGKAQSAITSLESAKSLAIDAKTLADDVAREASAVQDALAQASTSATESFSSVSAELTQVIARAGTTADDLLSKAGTARSLVDLGIGRIQPFVEALSSVPQNLQAVVAALPDSSSVKTGIQNAAETFAEREADLRSAVDSVSGIGISIEEATQVVSDASTSLDDASSQVSDTLASYSGGLLGSTAPAITSVVSQVDSASSVLSAAATDLEATIAEAQESLRQLADLLTNCNDALGQTDSLASSLQSDVTSIVSDVRFLAQSDAIVELVEGGSLDAGSIGEFMGSPTELKTVQMYHPNSYGTAMAPLFMNLTLRIGAFMLIIIFKTEVDDEGIKKLTFGQRYLSRFALFAGIAVVQAIICCAGVLALGVQVANVPAFS